MSIVTANPFNIGKDMKNNEQKKLMLLDDNDLITINLHLNQIKINELRNYLYDKYKDVKKTIEKDTLLRPLEENYYYDNDNVIKEVNITNRRTETKKEKIGIFQSRDIKINYCDKESISTHKPEALRLLQSINHRYISLVDFYNYIISCKGFNNKMRKSTIKYDISISINRYNDLIFFPNDVERTMSNDDLKDIINKIFDCLIIDSIEKKSIIDGNISINIDLSLEELITLKEELSLAKVNSEIINSDIIDAEENIISKILKKEK